MIDYNNLQLLIYNMIVDKIETDYKIPFLSTSKSAYGKINSVI